jgi:mono/diheme cytochrome c family protein
MACSFGEIDQSPIDDVPAPVTGTPSQADVDPAAPVSGTNGGSSTGAPNQQQPDVVDANPMGADGFNPEANPFESINGQQVLGIIEQNCGQCHSNGAVSGDMGYILDFNQLVANGKIVPGVKEDSQLYNRMLQNSMPPAFIRDQRPTTSQIDQVGQFIDELPPLAEEACEPSDTILSSDEQIKFMARDAASLDPEDAVFARYMTITYNYNAGGCGRELDRQRYALFKGVNSTSTNPKIFNPQPIDPNETIYRIDLRDLNWDRQIDLLDDGTVLFDDAWKAILDGIGEYAVEFTGDDADQLKEDTGEAIPFMSVNAFIQASEQGDLYYSLIGGKANLFDFERDVLKIDTVEEIANDNLMRAGFVNSGVSKQERVLNRFDSGVAGGLSYWISFDFDGGNGNGEVAGVSNGFEANVANESIFADPLNFAFAGGEAIFNLPNGIQAYYVAKADGGRLAEAPIGVVVDPAQNNGLVRNGASCPSCHNAGMIPFSDDVRRYVEEFRTDFDNETYEAVLAQYPTTEQIKAQTDRDSEIHVSAVERAGVPRTAPDAISRVFLDFELGNIDLRYAAGELNVSQEDLLNNIDNLSPQLQNLNEEGAYVDRDIFTANYLDSVCVFTAVQENTPVNCP